MIGEKPPTCTLTRSLCGGSSLERHYIFVWSCLLRCVWTLLYCVSFKMKNNVLCA